MNATKNVENKKIEALRRELLNCCFPPKTPTDKEVIALCKNFRFKLWSFCLKKENREEILKKINNESKIQSLLIKQDLLGLCRNSTWVSLLKTYGKIDPKSIYLQELCN